MPLQLLRQGIRLRADERSRLPLLDSFTNATPQAWVRAATQFEVALARGGGLVDVGNLASVTLEASPYDQRTASRVFSRTLAGSALDNALTEATWQDGTRQHALFTFSSTEMNVPLNGATRSDFWLVISVVTTQGNPLVCGAGRLTLAEDGAFTGVPVAPSSPTVPLTVDQGDVRYTRPGGTLNLAANITGTTGGGAAKLDGVPTQSLPTYYTLAIREAGRGLTAWVLEPDAEDAAGTRSVVPSDHQATSNARIWRQRL